MLTAAVLFSRAGDRHPVLVVTKRVAAGSTIAATDLRQALISTDGGVATVPSSQLAEVVGKTAVSDLVPGELLTREQIDVRPSGTTDQAVLGASLKEGQFPPGLSEGDRVLAIAIPPDDPTTAQASVDPQSVKATVVSVDPSSSEGGVTVSLALNPSQAASVAVSAAHGRLALVLAPA
jgi:Flp pilus assembly protein CpaB